MFTEITIRIFMAMWSFQINLLPDASALPADFNTAMTAISGYYNKANAFFPMDTLFVIIGIMLLAETIILGVKIVDWIWERIPGN